MSMDPIETNPESYKLVFENDQVRVLEYSDHPGYMPIQTIAALKAI